MNALAQPLPPGPIRICFEGIGTITLPSWETLSFLGGAAVLAFLGLVEWPAAVLLALTRLLSSARRGSGLRGLGEALTLVR
ncbi:hypothetical protein [Sinomonas susongensis]|uniref:hypothetical protein n=1 Tax=Sinomonas susongensis TaxID=1324851 RepID=UPI001109FEC5|nr:hypothetical protein [Sinomonas susongensis]